MGDPVHVKGHNGQIEFDGATIKITRKGALGRLSTGKGEKVIPVASITSVQWKPAGFAVNGYIQFVVSGAIEPKGGFGRQTTQAAQDDNSIVFTKSQMQAFESVRDLIQDAINHRHERMLNPTVVTASARSTAEELAHLAELRDQGILTEDEFLAQKEKILNGKLASDASW